MPEQTQTRETSPDHQCRWLPPDGYRPKETTFRWCPDCGEVRWAV